MPKKPSIRSTPPEETARAPQDSCRKIWIKLTGLPWAEAKRRGFTDRTKMGNLALRKKLLKGWKPPAARPASDPTAPFAPKKGGGEGGAERAEEEEAKEEE